MPKLWRGSARPVPATLRKVGRALGLAVSGALISGPGCVPKPPPPEPIAETSPYPDDFTCEPGTSVAGLPPPGGFVIWCQMQTATGQVLRHGPSIQWHTNGKRSQQGQYAQGKMDGAWSEWHATGTLAKELTYTNGVMEGPYVEYYLDGTKRSEGQMVNGRESGTWTYWTEGTGARLVGTYADGERNGTWLQYDVGGVPIRERTYRRGRLMSQRELVPTEAAGVPAIQVHSTDSTPAPAPAEPDVDLLEDEPPAEPPADPPPADGTKNRPPEEPGGDPDSPPDGG